ncbi:phosphoglycerate mutase-like protein [Pleomassaria siparia CBS 279.74]|uniref:Phosphoglycerate mutase-like protein n=1 Tax=Pleomassaria siparia CBS 279.74 TaxID=1314801 RepID=A0A6G1KHJ6_9PLEO|nr:phosphoglycerate mutase-like protein [Pleomassaria siparia CBS 279.74]
MTRHVKLFLIRHGETVDNVAQVYAGSRDSVLTNHGFQQATRLGLHFSSLGLCFTQIYSSHLQRASKTAGLIREAQVRTQISSSSACGVPTVVQLPILMEKDFGSNEGKKWYEKPSESIEPRQGEKNLLRFVDVESKDSMAQRADAFLDDHLLRLFDDTSESAKRIVAVVSHGMMLSMLWKRLLLRLPSKSVTFSPELAANPRISLDHLGAWSNTGYMELDMEWAESSETNVAVSTSTSSTWQNDTALEEVGDQSGIQPLTQSDTSIREQGHSIPLASKLVSPKLAQGWRTSIQTINGKSHLQGIKRTGGGVGSARHDASQKKIDNFFKRRRTD